jgi:hypothetical protein
VNFNNNPIKNNFGLYGLETLATVKAALSAIDEKIQLIYREKQKDFILANTGNIKQETIEKSLKECHFDYWEPLISTDDKGNPIKDDKGNFILSLLSSGSDSDSD